jgi:outer membrane protein
MKRLKIYIAACLMLPVLGIKAQVSADSLVLPGLLDVVMNNYPELKKTEKELTAADARIALTRTAKLPDVNFTSSYNRIGPVTSFNLGGKDVQLNPENMYSAAFSVSKNLLDFGKTNRNAAVDEKNKALQQTTIGQVRQRLTLAVLSSYFTICYLQEAIRIKEDQLQTLDHHLQFVQKKEATGSATQYDILSTKVRISSVENQKTDLQTSLKIQVCILNSYMGKDKDSPLVLKNQELQLKTIDSEDALCDKAYQNRPEMRLALQKVELSKLKLSAINVQNNPSLTLQATGGYKNGYFNSNMEDIGRFNYTIGLGFKVPVFDANRSKYAKVQAGTVVETSSEEAELVRRSITNEVIENRAYVEAAVKKIHQSELQLQQALQAYKLAEVSYKTGTITNLDLLDSYTSLSESKLTLFKARTDYSVYYQKLKLSVGETW